MTEVIYYTVFISFTLSCIYYRLFRMKVAQSCPTLCDPKDYTVLAILQAGILVCVPSPGDLPIPGIKHRPPTLQVDFLPAEPQEKPKNTEVGSISLLK